jgi:spermidine synthase
MPKRRPVSKIAQSRRGAARRWMLPIFVLSGFSGLVLEVIWVRLATLALGITIHAVAVIVAAFMAGLAIGSYLFGRIADARRLRLSFYAILEGGIAILGLGVTWLLQSMPGFVAAAGIRSSFHPAIEAGSVFILVLLPCILMGGTLPILSRTLADAAGTSRWVGWLYGCNTLGAVAGAFLADFSLVPSIGVTRTVFVAVACNGLAALLSVMVARWLNPEPAADMPLLPARSDRAAPWLLYVSYGITGFATLGLQMTWTRLFLMYMPGRAFVFSIILTTFLAGLAIGSGSAAGWAARSKRPAMVLVGMQVSLAVTALAGVLWINSVDRTLIVPDIAGQILKIARLGPSGSTGFRYEVLQGLGRAIALFALPTWLMGAIFPFMSRVALDERGGTGRPIGELYAANTVGAIAGSIAVAFWILPGRGAQGTLLRLAVMIVIAAALTIRYARPRGTATCLAAAGLLACVGFALLPADTVLRWVYLPQYSRHFAADISQMRLMKEGPYGTVAVVETPRGPTLLVDSVQMMGGNLEAQRYACLEGHLPVLLHPAPRQALVVCFGMGISMGAVSLHPGLERTRCVELNPTVLEAAPWFASINYDVLHRPRTEVALGDGRNFLLRSRDKFDVMTFEPPPPVNAGVVNLYSQEFYRLCRERLTPQGMVAQWVPLGILGDDGARMVIRTFLSVFPSASLWQGSPGNLVLIGSAAPFTIDANRLQEAFLHPELRQALQNIGVEDELSLLGTFLHGPEILEAYSMQAPIVTDDHPWLEYSPAEVRPVDRSLRQRSMAELQKYLVNLSPGRQAALQERLEAWQQLNDLASYSPSVPDETVRALYYYALAHRIRRVLPENRYVDLVLELDSNGMRKYEEAVRSDNPKAVGAWIMRLMLQLRYPEARALLQQAVEKTPRHPLPRLLLGIMAWSDGFAEEGQRQIAQGLDLLSTDSLRQMAMSLLQGSGIPIPRWK